MLKTYSQSLYVLLKRAMHLRCPNCGQTKLFKSYLKQIDACSVCDASYADIRADDGPAWLTILIAGHIIIPLFIILQGGETSPNWVVMVCCSTLMVGLVFSLLPFTKAFFITMIWRSQTYRR